MLQRHQTFRVLTKRSPSVSWEGLKTILTWAGLILAVLLPFGGIVWGLSAEIMAQKKELEFPKHETSSLREQVQRLERLVMQLEARQIITEPPIPEQPFGANRHDGEKLQAQIETSEPNDPLPSSPSSNLPASNEDLNNTMVKWARA